ncbi:MAG: transglutaminase-like domain-containing protein [Promicromonosporaceae bacterium]|nr:transglutaminase-like domain-containing protein [Promicromonosporaceae bacterium]
MTRATHPARTMATSLAVAVAIWGSLNTLSPVVQTGWLWIATGLLAAVWGATAVTRFLTWWFWCRHGEAAHPFLRRVIPTLFGLVAGCYFALLKVSVPLVEEAATGWRALLPAPGAAEHLGDLIYTAVGETQTSTAPMVASAAIVALIAVAAAALFLIADLLVTTPVPVVAVLPVVALWIPALGLGRGIELREFLLTVIPLLLALLLSGGNKRPDDVATGGLASVSTHRFRFVVVAVTVLAIVVSGGLQVRSLADAQLAATRLFPAYGMGSGRHGFTTGADLSQGLGARTDQILFRYSGGWVGPFRMITLTNFDGQNWTPLPTFHGANRALFSSVSYDGNHDIGALGLTYPNQLVVEYDGEGFVPVEQPHSLTLTMTFEALGDYILPITGDPRAFIPSDSDMLTFDSQNDQISRDRPTYSGEVLDLVVFPREITAESIRANTPEIDPHMPTWYYYRGREEHIQIPSDGDLFREIAEGIPGVATAVDKLAIAQAIQRYLRNTEIFTYAIDPPRAVTGNLVLDFLEQRTGFCQHFASAMVMLARSMDIPARFAMGFLGGTRMGDEFMVTGRDAHAWAELYFPGTGWVRFEPTPASISGPAPAHSIDGYSDWMYDEDDEWLLDGSYLFPYTNPTTGQYWQGSSDYIPDLDAGVQVTEEREGVSNVWWLALAVVALSAAGVIAVILVRRRRNYSEETAFTRAQAIIRQRTGAEVPDSLTPRQFPELVDAAWLDRHGTAAPERVRFGAVSIANAVEAVRYQGAPPMDVAKLQSAVKELKAKA